MPEAGWGGRVQSCPADQAWVTKRKDKRERGVWCLLGEAGENGGEGGGGAVLHCAGQGRQPHGAAAALHHAGLHRGRYHLPVVLLQQLHPENTMS